jgi:hypothetical protein
MHESLGSIPSFALQQNKIKPIEAKDKREN